MLKPIRQFLSLFQKPVQFESIQTEPISRDFGFSRGTPIDRYYIESFLEKNKKDIQGAVLEIAESTYSKKFNAGVTSYEVLHFDDSNKKATIIGDLTQLQTLPESRIDCFICTQTLNFIFEVDKAIEGSWKLLKENGVFLGTVSGISQISRYDMDRWGDYWRFTDLSIRKSVEKYFGEGNVEVFIYGNVLAATAFLKGVVVEDIPDISLLDKQDRDYQLTLGIRAIKKKK